MKIHLPHALNPEGVKLARCGRAAEPQNMAEKPTDVTCRKCLRLMELDWYAAKRKEGKGK